jgi:Flp pilus assembly CpaF family ATPase
VTVTDGHRRIWSQPLESTDEVALADAGTRGRIKSRLEERLVEEMGRAGRPLSSEDQVMLGQALVGEALRDEAAGRLARGEQLLSAEQESVLGADVVAEVTGAAGLEIYLSDPTIRDIDVNGPDNVHITYRDNRRERVAPIVGSAEALDDLIRLLARRSGVAVDGSPLALEFALPDGSRVTAVMGRVAPWPVLSIRLHRVAETDVEDLVKWRMMPPDLGEMICGLARCHRNIVFSGGTGVGKTTLASAWGHEIPAGERIVTVEDTYELGLHLDGRHSDVVPLLTRRPNVEDKGAVSMLDLTRLALRLNPSRVIVGEVRGGECVSLLDAMSQGNDGSCCTIHASSAKQAFTRMAKYASRAPEAPRREDCMYDIADAVHLVIHLGLNRSDLRPIVRSVREVTGMLEAEIPGTRPLWEAGRDGMPRRTANRMSPDLEDDLACAGVDPSVLAPGNRS